jgi:hypothetical protein
VPYDHLITIKPGNVSRPVKESGIRIVYTSANPFLDVIKLTLDALDEHSIDIVLCDLNGKIIIHQEEKNVQGVINLQFDTSGVSKGVYILRITSKTDGSSIIKKLVKI